MDVDLEGIRPAEILWKHGGEQITVMDYWSSIHRKRVAERVGRMAQRDCEYDFAPYVAERELEKHEQVFLADIGNRSIGLLIVEKRYKIYHSTWEDYDNGVFSPTEFPDPTWSIGLVWMDRGFRRLGWASRLLSTAAEFFRLGSVQEFGWCPPFSDDGRAIVERFCPDRFCRAF